MVAGGVALARRDDGRIVLVADALPGELVDVSVATRHGADHGAVVRIVEPSADRIEPLCPHVADGCGGCDLATLTHAAQVTAKAEVVTDALRRLGRWREPVVRVGPRSILGDSGRRCALPSRVGVPGCTGPQAATWSCSTTARSRIPCSTS